MKKTSEFLFQSEIADRFRAKTLNFSCLIPVCIGSVCRQSLSVLGRYGETAAVFVGGLSVAVFAEAGADVGRQALIMSIKSMQK